ncbi:hypothetical protein LTR85_011508 [Meristemomyces frigidus]|nr:hypothetical protein LTR85_011508 [Meristemomyces frigidus]
MLTTPARTLSGVLAVLAAVASAAATPDSLPPQQHSHRTTSASAGCGKSHKPGYHYYNEHGNFSIISGGLSRYYSVQVPVAYDASETHALIFDYHGNSDTSTEQHNNSQYYNYAASQDYVVIYPQGLDRHWEGPTYAVAGIDDLQFTTDLLAHVQAQYCIDSDRVYGKYQVQSVYMRPLLTVMQYVSSFSETVWWDITQGLHLTFGQASGKSNGGGFVDTLACSDHGDSFAAFAMASAALYTDVNRTDCSKKHAIIESHGDQDTVIPYRGGQGSGGPLPNVGEWVSWWGERNCGEDAEAQTSGDLGGYNITSYSCSGFENVTQHYHFAQLGHCWPNGFGDNYDAVHLTSQHCSEVRVLDYTPVVLDFFGRWDLKCAPKK